MGISCEHGSCAEQFATAQQLELHAAFKHVPYNDIVFVCGLCNDRVQYKSAMELLKHRTHVHKNVLYVCNDVADTLFHLKALTKNVPVASSEFADTSVKANSAADGDKESADLDKENVPQTKHRHQCNRCPYSTDHSAWLLQKHVIYEHLVDTLGHAAQHEVPARSQYDADCEPPQSGHYDDAASDNAPSVVAVATKKKRVRHKRPAVAGVHYSFTDASGDNVGSTYAHGEAMPVSAEYAQDMDTDYDDAGYDARHMAYAQQAGPSPKKPAVKRNVAHTAGSGGTAAPRASVQHGRRSRGFTQPGTSTVWQFFLKNPRARTAICTLCKAELKCNKGCTSHLRGHLRSKHAEHALATLL